MRPGHHRPLGTTTTMRFEWGSARLPELGDVARQVSAEGMDDADVVRRAYKVVGIIEGRERGRFKLVMERVEWGEMPEPGRYEWTFFNLPRK